MGTSSTSTFEPFSRGTRLLFSSVIFLAIRQPVQRYARADREANFDCPEHSLLRTALRHVQNVARLKLQILSLAIEHFLQIDGDFMLLSRVVLADDDGFIGLGCPREAPCQRKNLQGR